MEVVEPEPEYRDFPCAFACADCGQLHPPIGPAAGNPTRRSADAVAQPRIPCSHCQSRNWIDLSNVVMADVLRDSERARDRKGPRSLLPAPLALSVLGMLVTMKFEFATEYGYGIVLGDLGIPLWPFVTALIFGVTLGARLWQRRKHARTLPHRWSLSPKAATGPRTRGRARSPETLRAPVTGRPCVAYELAIHTADDPDADLGQLTLVEQRCADLEIDGVSFRGSGIRLALRRQRVELDPNNEVHRQAMQTRGLEPVGDAFTVYETVVAPEDPVAISGTETAATLHAAA